MFCSHVTTEIEASVRAALEEDPNFMPAFLARKLQIPEAVVVAALPGEMRSFVSADHFEKIWDEVRTWEKITFIVSSTGAIVEYKGKLPKGSFGHGYFNLNEKDHPLGGHLFVNDLAEICFLNKQLFGLESLSLQFYNSSGTSMFAIYAGREKREIIPAVKTAWMNLKQVCPQTGKEQGP